MPTQTESFIPGKDASLEFSIATMQQKLAARGFSCRKAPG
jgi:ribosomal protein S12 methylthiotransferase accessory factor